MGLCWAVSLVWGQREQLNLWEPASFHLSQPSKKEGPTLCPATWGGSRESCRCVYTHAGGDRAPGVENRWVEAAVWCLGQEGWVAVLMEDRHRGCRGTTTRVCTVAEWKVETGASRDTT